MTDSGWGLARGRQGLPVALFSWHFAKVPVQRPQSVYPGLKRELLVNFALLAAAAISLAVVTALLVRIFQPRFAALGLTALIAADVAVLFLFGRHLLEKLVLRPLADLTWAADELAAGRLDVRAPAGGTAELAHLADRFNRMTEQLAQAQADLVQAEKLAAVGGLAAGVAHEVGNPLAALGTYLEVLERRGADPEVLAGARRELQRIDRIVRGLITYARPAAHTGRPVDVAAVIRSAVAVLRAQGVLDGVSLAMELGEGLPPVRGRAEALEQVFVNLLLNAVDAAPRGPITVGAVASVYRSATMRQARRLDPPTAEAVVWGRRSRPRLPGGGASLVEGDPGVVAWVADGGPGVPEADRARVFDPFFTTKEPGRGTGLGLAIVQNTVHEMGGVVWVDDAREGGAAFRMFFPAQDA